MNLYATKTSISIVKELFTNYILYELESEQPIMVEKACMLISRYNKVPYDDQTMINITAKLIQLMDKD
jgi:hypothetical protein